MLGDNIDFARVPNGYIELPYVFTALEDNSSRGRLYVVKYILRHVPDAHDFTVELMPSWCSACANGHLEVAKWIEQFMDTENRLLSEDFPTQFDEAICRAKLAGHAHVVSHMRMHDVLEDDYDDE